VPVEVSRAYEVTTLLRYTNLFIIVVIITIIIIFTPGVKN